MPKYINCTSYEHLHHNETDIVDLSTAAYDFSLDKNEVCKNSTELKDLF